MKKIVKRLSYTLMAISIVLITSGISYSFFSYSKIGDKKIELIAGNIEFSYIEGESATLANAFPLEDSIGSQDTTGEYKFEVGLKSISNENNVAYDVVFVSSNGENSEVFKNNQIKYALIKNDRYVGGTSENSGLKLSEIEGFNENAKTGEGVALENQKISKDQKDNYKLRI